MTTSSSLIRTKLNIPRPPDNIQNILYNRIRRAISIQPISNLRLVFVMPHDSLFRCLSVMLSDQHTDNEHDEYRNRAKLFMDLAQLDFNNAFPPETTPAASQPDSKLNSQSHNQVLENDHNRDKSTDMQQFNFHSQTQANAIDMELDYDAYYDHHYDMPANNHRNYHNDHIDDNKLQKVAICFKCCLSVW